MLKLNAKADATRTIDSIFHKLINHQAGPPPKPNQPSQKGKPDAQALCGQLESMLGQMCTVDDLMRLSKRVSRDSEVASMKTIIRRGVLSSQHFLD